MNKTKLFVGIIALFSLCSLLIGSDVQPDSEWRLIETLYHVGAKPERYVLHLSGRTETSISQKELSTLVQDLSSALQLVSPQHTSDENGVEWKASRTDQRNLHVKIHVLNDEPNLAHVYPYISLRLDGKGVPGKEVFLIKKRLAPVLKRYGVPPRFQFSIQGSRTKVHPTPDQTVGEVLQVLHAQEIESMRSKRTTSVSAYTPLLAGKLWANGNLMNVQVAAREGSDQQGLILTLGTPIITIEY